MKRKKPRSDSEDRRNQRRRALRSIEDREWDEESKHLDEELSDWLEEEEMVLDSDADWTA
jgi:hypothetical protein